MELNPMNVLELVRNRTKKQKALQDAQKQLCYRGVVYEQKGCSCRSEG